MFRRLRERVYITLHAGLILCRGCDKTIRFIYLVFMYVLKVEEKEEMQPRLFLDIIILIFV